MIVEVREVALGHSVLGPYLDQLIRVRNQSAYVFDFEVNDRAEYNFDF